MSEIHSCGYFCQIPACVLKQRDTLRDKLQTSESSGPLAAAHRAIEMIRAAGGVVHKDGNIFFTNVGMFNSACAALASQPAPAVQALQPLNRARVQSLIDAAGYVHAEQKAHFINGIRHAEMAHGITATPQPEPTVHEGVKS